MKDKIILCLESIVSWVGFPCLLLHNQEFNKGVRSPSHTIGIYERYLIVGHYFPSNLDYLITLLKVRRESISYGSERNWEL